MRRPPASVMQSLLKQAHQRGLPSVQTLVQRPMGNGVHSCLLAPANPSPAPLCFGPAFLRVWRRQSVSVSVLITVKRRESHLHMLNCLFPCKMFSFFLMLRSRACLWQLSGDNLTNCPIVTFFCQRFGSHSNFARPKYCEIKRSWKQLRLKTFF